MYLQLKRIRQEQNTAKSPQQHTPLPIMPVPWEAMLPMGIVVVMFGVTGSGFRLVKQLTNDGKVSLARSWVQATSEHGIDVHRQMRC